MKTNTIKQTIHPGPRCRILDHGRNAAGILLLLAVAASSPAAGQRKFYADDPIAREPETKDASGAQPRDIHLSYDLGLNLFTRPGDPRMVRAQNINTIDEVPDSSWFTNRIGVRPMSLEEITRGPNRGDGPDFSAPWEVIRGKSGGITPGFTMRDRRGDVYFVKFDPPAYFGLSTGADVMGS